MASPDRFKTTQGPWPAQYAADPARSVFAVTTSDSADLPNGVAKSLYVGVSGDVTVIPADGSTGVTFKAHPVGYLLCQVSRVLATGTTATNIVALY